MKNVSMMVDEYKLRDWENLRVDIFLLTGNEK